MRMTPTVVVLTFALCAPAAAQQQTATDGSSTQGEPGPLQVWVVLPSDPTGELPDSASVEESVRQAMLAEWLPPDVVVARLRNYYVRGRYLLMQLDTSPQGEVRLRHAVMDDGGEGERCGGESLWEAGAALRSALLLSHRVRDVLACVKREYRISW
jgi:hypothetical protein